MIRNLKTYVKGKKNPVSTSKKSAESYAPCYLCENQELPDLGKTIEGTFGKTCEDVHLELLSMQKEKHASICAARQALYQKTCCPKQNGLSLGKPSKTAFMTIIGAFVFWIVIRKLGGRRKAGRVAASEDEPSTYTEMDDDLEKARDPLPSRSRSRSCSRSRKKQRKRSRSRELKPKKDRIKNDADLCSVNAVLAAEASIHPTQVV
mmetsp:Transcript_91853/g.137576  ORF Transcript_91853/g.137576 Transcript_91853/m.137576 type:complete len:206 (+) Transcript_91853:149-766(+)